MTERSPLVATLMRGPCPAWRTLSIAARSRSVGCSQSQVSLPQVSQLEALLTEASLPQISQVSPLEGFGAAGLVARGFATGRVFGLA
jgi:hypothetical protein